MGDTLRLGLLITASAGAAVGGVTSVGSAIDKLKASTDKANASQRELGSTVKALGASKSVDLMAQRYTRLGQTIEKAKAAQLGFQAAQERAAGHKAAIGGMMGQALGTVGVGMTLALPVKQAIDYESAVAGIKTMIPDATADQMKSLSGTLLGMSRTMPVSAVGLAEVAKNAGQLGIAINDIPDFTKIVAKVSTAFEMPANESAEYMAKMANVYDIPMSKMTRMGDVVSKLAAVGTATPAGIINATSRVGGEANLFGMTVEQVAAWTNTFIGLGEQPENVGTAMIKMFTNLSTADQGTKEFTDTLKSLGISAKQLKKDIGQDANGTLEKLFETIRKAPQGDQAGIMKGLFGEDAGARLAQLLNVRAPKLLADSFAAMKSADGTMDRVFLEKAATTANSLQLLKNNATELGITVGATLLPALNRTINTLKPIVYTVIEWSRAHPELVSYLGQATAALVAFSAAGLVLRAGYHGMAFGALSLLAPFKAVRASWLATSALIQDRSLGAAVARSLVPPPIPAGLVPPPIPIGSIGGTVQVGRFGRLGQAVGALLKPFTLLARAALFVGSAIVGITAPAWIAVVAVGAAFAIIGIQVYRYWQPIKAFFSGLWKGLKAGLAPLFPMFKGIFAPLAPMLKPCINAVTSLGGWFKNLLKPVTDVGDGFEETGKKVGLFIGRAITQFAKLQVFLAGLPLQFKKIGSDLVMGLLQGITGKFAEAKNTIVNLGSSVKGWFSSTLGISSPSRVFRQLGGFLGDGLTLGIQGSIGKVTAAAGMLSKASIPQLGNMAMKGLGLPTLPNIGGMARQALSSVKLPNVGGMLRQALPIPKLPNLQGMAQQALSAPLRALPAIPKIPNMQKAVHSAMSYSPTINMAAGMGADVAGQVRGAVDQSFEQFRKQMKKFEQEMGRRAFGGALG